MSEDTESSITGRIYEESFDCDIITWKIPNVSSLEISGNNEVQSPQFSYKNGTWNLTISTFSGYFDNHDKINVTLERVYSEIPRHNFSYCVFFKKHDVVRFGNCYFDLNFHSNQEKKCLEIQTDSWNNLLYRQKDTRHNDTIVLVLEIVTKKNAAIGLVSETKVPTADLSNQFDKNKVYLKSVGDLSTESFDIQVVEWKILTETISSVKVDESVLSPTFSFAGASWILKVFFNGQTKFKSENRTDLIIERVHSEIQKHSILYNCFFKPYEYESLENFYIDKNYKRIGSPSFTNSLTVDSNHTQENIIDVTKGMNINTFCEEYSYIVLIFESRIPKNLEIGLDFCKESLQTVIKTTEELAMSESTSFVSTCEDFKDTTSKDILKPITGEIMKESANCEVIRWKIPNVSSLVHKENNFIQSPSFTFKGARWILELRPNNPMTVVLKRLYSQIPEHSLSIKICFQSEFNNASAWRSGSFMFDKNHAQSEGVLKLSFSLLGAYEHYRSGDTFTLVCEIYTEGKDVTKFDSKATSIEAAPISNSSMKNDDSPESTGKLSVESFDTEFILWKIPKMRSKPIEIDNDLQSPSFVFEGACWIFKLYLYGQTEFNSKGEVDVVFERWSSPIPKHFVSYKFFFRADEEKFWENKYKLKDFITTHDRIHSNSFAFYPNHTQEKVVAVIPYVQILTLALSNKQSDSIILEFELRTKKNARIIFNNETNSTIGSPEKTLKEGPTPTESLERTLEEPVSIDSQEKTFKEEPVFTDFNSLGPEFVVTSTGFAVSSPAVTATNRNFNFGTPVSAPANSGFTFSTTTGFIFGAATTTTVSSAVDTRTHTPTVVTTATSGGLNFSTSAATSPTTGLPSDATQSNTSFGCFETYKTSTPSTPGKLAPPITSATSIASGQAIATTTALTFKKDITSSISPVPFQAFSSLATSGATFGTAVTPTFSESVFGTTNIATTTTVPTTTLGTTGHGNSSTSTTLATFSATNVMSMSTAQSLCMTSQSSTSGFQFATPYTTNGASLLSTSLSFNSRHQALSSESLKFQFQDLASTSRRASFGNSTGFDCKPSHPMPFPIEKLLRDLKELFLRQENCDAILRVKGREFPVHRIILTARSPVFASAFKSEMKEKASGIVDIGDCDPSSFSDFLQFLYYGSTENLSTANVFSLFKTADKYDVQDLRSECLEFIKKNLSVDNFCDTIALALQYSEKEVIKLATKFFAKYYQKIIVTVKWQSFLLENPLYANEILIKALVPVVKTRKAQSQSSRYSND